AGLSHRQCPRWALHSRGARQAADGSERDHRRSCRRPALAGADGAGLGKDRFLPRLIVVSNRVPVPTSKGSTATAGGLAVALEAALKAHGGLWFGWSGKTSSER